ncbi:flagellar filament capping protein FliD [Helicobacter cappadocius]|uniref:Flagellar hook-associated protein 2 n=1 Tax=Helicobacter cappadocius TaxID=3063998 RepID=A0AA90PK17_9HELI|nr:MULTISPECIES: flagellar filament capping protein FliD [unclassified Helicobacter]MDO7253380.1 flagellar filament capping protein FliD [Helicobacter sp. faydin-H75]MDP2539356.1 flagellar filament capping protein FliD [Helicobacter sp. faydin-H76]
MAMGKLSSLGIGSNVLNYDVIDKLKKADEKTMIAPIDKKMETNVEKQKELVEIKSLISNLKTPAKNLSDSAPYMARTSNVTGDAIKASVSAGVPIQDIKIDVESLAQGDINEVGTKFSSRDDAFSDRDVKLKFFTNGKNYTIDIKAGMSVGDVAQAITDTTKGEVNGIIMKTGGAKPYQLMINSKNTGEANKIYFGSILSSEPISDKPIDLAEGDFVLTLKDKNGNDQTINVISDLKDSMTSQDKAQALKQSIKDAISKNSDTKDLLDSDINVGLSDDGKSLVLNDRRGYEIKLSGKKLSELGFNQTNSNEDDLLVSNITVKPGHLEGIMSIGSVPLNLAKLTKKGNTSEQNAKIIAEAIENIAGMHAKTDGNGKLILNSEIGEINISAKDDKGVQAIKDLGLKQGIIQGYSKLEQDLFKFKNLQSASDAKFSYNGVSVTRPTNDINDVISGVSLTLQGTTEPGKPAIISIGRDNQAIIDNVKEFVKAYNELIPKLDEVTRYDAETKIAGIFNGVSDIRTIRSSINNVFSQTMGSGADMQSLMKYGLSLDDKSKMSLDEAQLSSAINSDPQKVQDFFYGTDKKSYEGKEIHEDGVFVNLNKVLAGLVDGSTAKLKVYEESLDRDAKNLQKDKTNAMDILKTRYDIMSERFAAYDSQIAKANNAFNSVQMMIDQSVAKKK